MDVDIWWVPGKSWNFPQTSQLSKGSKEVKSSVSCLWGLQVEMGWCWKWVLLNIAAIHSSTASHLWWTFPSTSSKYPPKLQWIHCFADDVGCLWYGELGRIQGNAVIPWNCSMAHCHSWVWMVIQTYWKIIPSSLITACVELFGSFLTIRYLVK